MRKLFLLFVACGLASAVSAQNANQSVVFEQRSTKMPVVKQSVETYHFTTENLRNVKTINGGAAHKTTATTSRWYSHVFCIDTLNSTTVTSTLFPIWFDSTIRQRFSTGLDVVNFSSVGEVVDPVTYDTYNDPALFGATEMRVRATDAYTVDSVQVVGAYVKNTNRPVGVVDTLIFSVAIDDVYFLARKSSTNTTLAAVGNTYAPAGKDTCYMPWISDADSINRAAFSTNGPARIIFKKTLTDADRDTVSSTGSVTLNAFTFAVPGGFNVPAGSAYSITCTFKSGDTWVKNVDTINGQHRFLVLTDQPLGANSTMPYNWYDLNDRNMSQLLFSTDSSFYYPTMLVEGINSNSFSQEFHNINSHITCSSCQPIVLGVANVSNTITEQGAFPVPANASVHIPFVLNVTSDATVTLTNTLGQIVKVQNLKNITSGTATFNVADLSTGVYFYSIVAGDAKTTGRVVVAH